MKITDKIVTSVTQPQQTNVLWHNPETGELKMFGNKGWEVVGGNPGGYPVVTVEDNFNIEAKPNTFYNIKNSTDTEVNINCMSDKYSVDEVRKLIFIDPNYEGNEDFLNLSRFFIYGILTPISDNTKDGYKYKTELDLTVVSNGSESGIMTIYFSDEIKNGNNVNCLINASTMGIDETTGLLNNIRIVNENNNYIVYITHPSLGSIPHILTEIENDNNMFSHKYYIYGNLNSMVEYVYTTEPYTSATDFYVDEETTISDMGASIEIKPNMYIPPCNTANEFVFNINSPATIIFNEEIKWNNNSIPDLTNSGIYTISIVNGVGCYTFINN